MSLLDFMGRKNYVDIAKYMAIGLIYVFTGAGNNKCEGRVEKDYINK